LIHALPILKKTFKEAVYSMKRFIFSIDSEEIEINANSILEAVSIVKEVMKNSKEERNLKFVGVKY
jgi:hypothetical protein